MSYHFLLSITISLLFQSLWMLDIATSQSVECVSIKSNSSFEADANGGLREASIGCNSTYPVLLSCGYSTLGQLTKEVRGNTIQYFPGNDELGDPQRCTTQSSASDATTAAFAYAQCCKFPETASITCDHYRDETPTNTGNGAINTASCADNSDLSGGLLFSCTSRNVDGNGIGTGGTYPFSSDTELSSGTFPASLSVCTAQTLDIGDTSDQAVQGEMQCCTISNGNDILECEYIIDKTDGIIDKTAIVGCNSNQFIAGCAGWVNSTDSDAVVKYEMYIFFMCHRYVYSFLIIQK